MTSTCGNDRKSGGWLLHPYEIAFCGFSGSGKTTLLERLAASLAARRGIGYLKSDAHEPAFDREGKDTWRLARAGATDVAIRSSTASFSSSRKDMSFSDISLRMIDADVLLVEGFKSERVPKVLVLDQEDRIWTEHLAGRVADVRAVVHAGRAPRTELPCFHRDDIAGIAIWLEEEWRRRHPRLRGLVLAGGQSRRMGEDKAVLAYRGSTQAEYLRTLLSSHCADVFLSRAPGQSDIPGLAASEILEDRFTGFGPLGGILTATMTDPLAAWLVVGCDLPLLDAHTVGHLIAQRDSFAMATAFLDADGRFPEPMCAIYEPKFAARAFAMMGLLGVRCPRKVLLAGRIRTLPHPDGGQLRNANTPDEREELALAVRRRLETP